MAESYYKQIDGKKYDRNILEFADEATDSNSNQISLAEAKGLFGLVADGGEYTDIEKDTVSYVRDNYSFTDKADDWFRSEIRSWAAKQ